jgi:hypothetical protein
MEHIATSNSLYLLLAAEKEKDSKLKNIFSFNIFIYVSKFLKKETGISLFMTS